MIRVCTTRRFFAWLLVGYSLFSFSASSVETAPIVLDPQPEGAVAKSVDPLHDTLADTLELLETNGLSFDGPTARRSIVKALATTADPYAKLLTEAEHQRLGESGNGVAYDTGIHFVQSNRFAVITRVAEDSSAAESGIQAGDNLLRVGDEPAAGLNVAEIQERLRDQDPGQVMVTIRRGEEDPVDHTLDQRRVTLDSIEESIRLPAGLGYIRINGLFPGAGDQIADILGDWSLAGIDGVVLDLRGANGGDVESVITVASLMSKPESLLFSFRDANDQDQDVLHAQVGASLGAPLMLLIDKQTSGAAELLAAVLSGTGRGAMLIGTPTAGDPMIREPVALSDGYVLYIAARRVVVADGKIYAGAETVRPDIVINPHAVYPDFDPVAPVLTDQRQVTDQELETEALRVYINGDISMTRAVDVLMGLKALNLHSFDYEGPVHP